MNTSKYKDIPIIKLKLLFSGTPPGSERDEIMNEMMRQELAKESRDTKNHFIQKIIMILSILIFIFTAITFFSPLFNDNNKVTQKLPAENPEKIQTGTTKNSPYAGDKN